MQLNKESVHDVKSNQIILRMLFVILPLLGVSCGEPTYGPLEKGGRADREDLAIKMYQALGYLPDGVTSLDGLIVNRQRLYPTDDTVNQFYEVTARMVDEEGYMRFPAVVAGTTVLKPFVDKQLLGGLYVPAGATVVYQLQWPQWTVSLTASFPSTADIGGQTDLYIARDLTDTTPVELPGVPGEWLSVSYSYRYHDTSYIISYEHEGYADQGHIRAAWVDHERIADVDWIRVYVNRSVHRIHRDPSTGMEIGIVTVISYDIEIDGK